MTLIGRKSEVVGLETKPEVLAVGILPHQQLVRGGEKALGP